MRGIKKCVRDFEKTLNPEKLSDLIGDYPKRMREIVAVNGRRVRG